MTLSVERMKSPDGGRELLDICQRLIEQAKQQGATDAEAFAEYVKGSNVSLEQNDIKGAEIGEHQAMGIRVFINDQMGFSYVNRFDPDAMSEALSDALTIARTSPGDPANGLVSPQPVESVPEIWDETVPGISPDAVVDHASRMLRSARGIDERVSVDTGSVSLRYGHEAIASTRGVATYAGSTGTMYGLFGMAVDGDDVGSFDHVYHGGVRYSDMDTETLGREFGNKVIRLLGARESRPYQGPVLFSAEAFEEIFVGTILEGADGDNVTKGRSLLRDKLHGRIAPDVLSIVDDGRLPGGVASFPFDREGLPHRRTALIQSGVLTTFLYDGKAARRAGTNPTGNASGSARSLPGIGTTNLKVLPGNVTEEELLRRLGTGLFVGRFSGTTDAVSGDFSGVAKGSFWVEGQERKHAVKETLIAGNAVALLSHVMALGSTLHRDYAFEGPWVLVDGVDVTSA